MAWLAAAAPYIAAAGTAVSAAGTIAGGRSQKAMADYQSKVMRQQANDELAASQRDAEQTRRRAEFAESRARALAASSGAGATDKTVLDIMEGISEEGEYQALSQLYSGRSSANMRRAQADLTEMEGSSARRAGYTRAGGTILSQGASLLDKYG